MEDTAIVGWRDTASSAHAAEWLAERQARLGRPMVLIHVKAGATPMNTLRSPRSEKDDGAEHKAAQLRRSHPNLDVAVRTVEGDPLDVLRDLSAHSNLVAVGRQGASTRRAAAASGLSERLASTAPGPVAIVPDEPSDEHTGIVVGVDGTESSLEALAFAAQEASDRGERLEVVHTWLDTADVTSDARADRAATNLLKSRHEALLRESLARVLVDHPGLIVQQLVVQGLPAKVLLREAFGARLLVVGNHGRQSVARFLLGSVSSAVLRGAERVTVVVKGSAFAEPSTVDGSLSAPLHPEGTKQARHVVLDRLLG